MDDDIYSKTRNVGPIFPEGFFSDPKDSYVTEIDKRGSFLINQTLVTGHDTTAREAEADAHLKYRLHKEHQSYLAQKRAENERLASLRSGSYSGSYYPHNSATVGDWILRAILILSLVGVGKCTVWCMRTEIEATFGPNSHHLDHWLYK